MTRLLVWLISVPYQKFWTRFTPECPMTPCCSQYALDVIREQGWRQGIILAYERLMACGE
jgi:putative component of membrane protein insertase Oxa1/YidC/SpoIIIJ protein YidD